MFFFSKNSYRKYYVIKIAPVVFAYEKSFGIKIVPNFGA